MLLFRGGFFGETVGLYVSQFLLQNTSLGALPIDQKYTTLTKGVDYMTDPTTFLQVQNGISTGLKLSPLPTGWMCPYRCANETRMDAVTKADIMRQLMQLAAHGHLSSIAARVVI